MQRMMPRITPPTSLTYRFHPFPATLYSTLFLLPCTNDKYVAYIYSPFLHMFSLSSSSLGIFSPLSFPCPVLASHESCSPLDWLSQWLICQFCLWNCEISEKLFFPLLLYFILSVLADCSFTATALSVSQVICYQKSTRRLYPHCKEI